MPHPCKQMTRWWRRGFRRRFRLRLGSGSASGSAKRKRLPHAARYHGAVPGEASSTGSSDRQFGLLVGCLLSAAAAWPVLRGGHLRVGLLAGGLVLVFLGAVWPRVLKPVNRLWLLLGQTLGRVTNPLVAGLLFLMVIAPLGLVLRRMGRLSVRLRKDSPAPSYWQETSHAASPAERMHFQF